MKKTSVADFQRDQDLWQDLLLEHTNLSEGETDDWALKQVNVEDTAVKTLQDEYKRLTVLKSYNVTGVKGVDSLDKLVSAGASIFNMPLCVVSLVDLRRLWFLSTQGLGDLREIPRKDTLCSHSIWNMNDIMVVPDCTQDKRFEDLFTVTGAPYLKFYAGACMKAPEGYSIGTFCVMDTEPHPEGLTETQIKILKDLAATAMKLLEDRRYRQEMETVKRPLLAQTAHELMTPLTAINLSLEALKEDVHFTSNPSQREIIETATASTHLMTEICRRTIASLRECGSKAEEIKSDDRFVCVSDLLKSLDQIIRSIPKRVPVFFHEDAPVAQTMVKDELAVFRVSLGLISIACSRTEHGSILFKATRRGNELTFECKDCAGSLNPQDRSVLFETGETLVDSRLMGLSRMSQLVQSIGGVYGFDEHPGGTLFWFSVPPCAKIAPKGHQDFAFSDNNSRANQPSITRSLLKKRSRDETDPNTTPKTGNRQKSSNSKVVIGKQSFRRVNSLPSVLHDICMLKRKTVMHPKRLGIQFNPILASDTHGEKKIQNAPWRTKTGLRDLFSTATQNPKMTPPLNRIFFSPTQGWKKRALVVDDSLVIRKSLSRSLAKHGYTVESAENGQEGLTKMQEGMFDFVLCDFLMPVMDGLDCVKQFRKWEARHRPWHYQCIFGITAHADTQHLEKGIDVGMDKYFKKPISFKLLKELPSAAESLRSARIRSEGNHVFNGPLTKADQDYILRLEDRVCHLEEALQLRRGIVNPTVDRVLCTTSLPKEYTNDAARPSCLVASSDETANNLEADGWTCTRVHSDEDTLRLLKKRNWDAVVIDSHLQSMSGFETISTFRAWERHNRVNRQSNVFLLCSVLGHNSNKSHVHTPEGFDGGLRSEQLLEDFRSLVCHERDRQSGLGATLNIITH